MDRRNRGYRDYRRSRKGKDDLPEEVKFYKHLTSFVIVNGVFLLLSGGSWMPIVLFWGIGLFFHYIKAFGIGQNGFLSEDWENEKREEYRSGKRSRRSEPEFEEEEELELRPLEKEKKPSWDDRDLV